MESKKSLKSSSFLTKLQMDDFPVQRNSSIRIMKRFVTNTIEEQKFSRMKKKEYSKSIEDLLIDELHKPITPFIETIKEIISNQVFNRKKSMSVLLEEIQPKKRNIDVCIIYYVTLAYCFYITKLKAFLTLY